MRVMGRVAAAWDCRPHPRRRFGYPDDVLGLECTAVEAYQQVTDVVSDRALQATLEHVRRLYDHRRLRGNLRAVAFLERFETVVCQELQRRSRAHSAAAAAAGTSADAGAATR
jgi:hypothetical protein